MKEIRFGIVGCGLVGRELASAMARWIALVDFPARATLTAVCDTNEKLFDFFRAIPTVKLFTADYRELLRSPDVDAVYVALPHHLHEQVYCDVIAAGKHLLGEKPFGIDRAACERILKAQSPKSKIQNQVIRCSSEIPFFPGPQRIVQMIRDRAFGRILEVRASFLHSSDLDPNKPINWKRQTQFCGQAGVLNDLGMHPLHIPLRVGWKPKSLYAQLQKIFPERPDGKGGVAACDTWDNAILHCNVETDPSTLLGTDGASFPMTIEAKRIAPGEMNTWSLEVLGTKSGVRYSTKQPKTLWTFRPEKEQAWATTDLGSKSVFPTVTGGIFEFGFSDAWVQMLAAFVAEATGNLGDRFGCVTPQEALDAHRIYEAALRSHAEQRVVKLP